MFRVTSTSCITAAALFLLVNAGVLSEPAPAAEQMMNIAMEDQFRTQHETAGHRGDVVVLVYAERHGAEAALTLGRRLHLQFHPTADSASADAWSKQPVVGLPGWPDYWYGFPPMHYATHAVSPLLCLADKPVESVVCFGSGRISEDYSKLYNSPFAIETALLKLADLQLACEVTRSLFDTIRQYRESFDVYGTKLSFEWEQIAGEGPVIYSGYEDAKRIEVPDYGHLLPDEIAPFTGHGVYDEEHEHTSFIQGAGHGGSHPHLAHEFLRAIIEGRESSADAKTAANWTMAGICAHESAMNGGKRIEIPQVD